MITPGTIYCGDCLEVMREWPDACVDLVLTDIPYGEVNDRYGHHGGLRDLHKGDADVVGFDLEAVTRELVRLSSGSVYVFCGIDQVSTIRSSMAAAGLSTRLGIWRKSNPSPMNGEHIWLSGIECCVFGKKAGATFNEHCKNCVWDFPSGESKIHPTQKPVALFSYLICASSNPGDLVLDPFIGSGTTAVAAERSNRKWVGVEINPEYCELARLRAAQRGLDFTGEAA